VNPGEIQIFVIDDEPTITDGIALALVDCFEVLAFATAEAALDRLVASERPPDLVLLDVGLPGMNGIEALKIIKQKHPDLLVIIITAYEDVSTAVTAMKLGAYDYVVKPLQMESLIITINNALDSLRLRRNLQLIQEQCLQERHPYFIGESNAIIEVMELVNQVAKSPDTTILILGETGTGKELIADTIHYKGPNFKGPFVKVNCASFAANLIESELFGYESGAFTGAEKGGKKGLIEQAEGGTLFLDEVGDLSLEAQAKLLRFLEEGEFYRLGGTKLIKVQTRVVSATNKDLEGLIAEERFRKDLFYRLGVVNVRLPSLNERQDDILAFARYFLARYCEKFDKPIQDISVEAQQALLEYHWRGNIRELKNVIQRGVLIATGPEITCRDLGLSLPAFADSDNVGISELETVGEQVIDLTHLLRRIEMMYMAKALKKSGGNESAAARLLNMNHHTFRYRWKKLQNSKAGGR